MPCAYNLTRKDVHYRHDAFSAGLRAAGFEVRDEVRRGRPGDVLLIWNRYGQYHQEALRFERDGGTVVVAENGYLGRDADDNQLYALAKHGHNGSGSFRIGEADRFASLGVELAPWRVGGDKIVIRGQRGIGSPDMASPPGWHAQMHRLLAMKTKRPIQVIPHPGNGAERDRSHEDYLQGAHALVVWSSSVGVKALALGIPVFYCAPHWICSGAAARLVDDIETPIMDDEKRLAAMRRMAWAQWRLAEIESGEAFRTLLQ